MSSLFVNTIKHTNATTAMTIDSSGRVSQSSLPIFHAVAVGGSGGGGQSLALTTTSSELTVFTQVNVNKGNHYNNSTCRFTAPIAGTYEFEMFFLSGNANDVYRFDFAKNGSMANFYPQLRLDTSDTTNTDYEFGSAAMFIELAANDYMSVFGKSDAGNNAFVSPQGTYSYFRGRFVS